MYDIAFLEVISRLDFIVR